MRFKDKVVLVTGGAQGLGKAICEKFAGEGATVVVADINETTAKATAAEIEEKYKVTAQGINMDVTDDFAVHTTMEEIEDTYGGLEVLIANAGILKAREITQFPVSEWRQVIEVNLIGYMICAKHACQIMQKRKSGSIIQINSKSGKKGSFRNSAYAASKFGGIGLTQSLALEMAEFGVRVNAVCPGNLLDGTLWQDSLFKQYAQTQGLTVEEVRKKYMDQVPLGRGCSYDDVTSVVAFLASDEASYMTGQAINITGGQEMR
ncbi:MAG: sorbitol-6-phosphate dehydrogenase [Armatimonadetes bacterium]|jgi:sorbitol-6-phosphate 2-dehydrogenase|nr:sorbitol-6-phosphate dehydrogenase [Armatimonadota bacterium]